MYIIETVDLSSKPQVNAFVQFQYDLYKGVKQFCPPFFDDIKLMLNKKKHHKPSAPETDQLSSALWSFWTMEASTAVDQPNISIAVIASKPPKPRQRP